MDTGAAAAAFSPPIFRPALPSFTWQTPRATFGVLIVRQRRSLRSSVSLFAALHAPSFLLGIRASLPLLLPPDTRAFAHFPPPVPSPFEKSRSLAFMTGTHLLAGSPVTQRNERCFFAWLIREIKCARGQGISDGDSHLRSFLSLSLCLSFSAFASLRTCEHRSKRKPRKTRLFTLEKNLTTSFTKRLRIYAGLKDETRFNPRALLPSRCSDD